MGFLKWAAKKAGIVTYVIPDYFTDQPYLTRTVFPRVFGFRPLLHRFHQGDGDRALHNHPWRWACSVVLRGSYTEERLWRGDMSPRTDDTWFRWTRTRRVRWFNLLRHTDFHRVVKLHGKHVWTLFFVGPRMQEWGFLEEHGVTPHESYIAAQRLMKSKAVGQ